MKTYTKRAAAAFICAAMVTACASCGAKDNNLGKYNGTKVNIMDMGEKPMSEVFEGGDNYIELKADGKGTFAMGGDTAELTWKTEGEKITISVAELGEANGTIKDGVIETDFFGENTMTLIYAK
ncbi:MAG: hypothetical protein ACI4KR_13190 [Ruminiclostridium sp.]